MKWRLHFGVRSLLLAIVVCGVVFAWWRERLQRQAPATTFLAAIKTPAERSVYVADATIPIRGVFLALNPHGVAEAESPPRVVIHFSRPRADAPHGFVVAQSSSATVAPDTKNAGRFTISCDIKGGVPFRPGTYVLRAKCFVKGEEVVTPSRTIIIKPTEDASNGTAGRTTP